MQKTILSIGKNSSDKLVSSQRIYFLAVAVFFMGVIIIARLYILQIRDHARFRIMADDQHGAFSELSAKRGEIYLKNRDEKYPLAVNKEYMMVFLEPKMVAEKDRVVSELSYILGIERIEIEKKLSNSEDMFEIVKKKISQEEADKITELKLKGVKLLGENYRYYPGKELASQIVGFVGSNGEQEIGRYGLESFWEEELQGKNGSIFQERDSAGRWISITDRKKVPAQDGADLVLTIDQAVQYEIEKILKLTMEKYKADGGSILVQEPSTGKLLAMASYPNFNPNEFGKVENMSVFTNPAITNAYESGSVFKTVTLASGIDAGVISPNTTYVDNGVISEAGYNIKNSDGKSNGTQTMTQVLEKSLNTGVIFTEKLMGNKKFAEYVRNFGFGEKTGITLPNEAAGDVRNLNNLKSDIQFFTASFGQGITTTPLQILNAYSVIANGGNLMRPQVVEKKIYSDGREESVEPKIIRRVIKEETAKQMKEMLESVVVNGHGKRAAVSGYRVGGKTGTAQVAKQGGGGYEESITIGSFTGIAPLDNPRFAVIVKIDNPKDVQWAESSAAPTCGEVLKFLLNYYNVEPTEPIVKEISTVKQ
ncbi:MAG: Peptidoglycan glycosyltransferase [Candidatus Moranbacteria bacterium GW2011_GWE1_35_17]|nr:MAG: Peptidoglycan glycosyltransferase [Candidatus Moranbacteria bacterium GW2011_GWE1_35_17]KKP84502.1 MAG: Peptidoglycan glycosyltransferase [Candidatus Moranbacteria bacterium GW2011_GWF1_35_5]